MKRSDIRIAFFGTSEFSTIILDQLLEAGFMPALLISTPDTKQGRGLKQTPPPVKEWGDEHGIDTVQFERLDNAAIAELNNSEWDLFIVASYGKILPQALLEIPTHGVLNVHPSLLPKWRGPSPIQAAILNDTTTGITIMCVDEEIDHGPIVAQASVELDEWPPRAALLTKLLATEGGKLLAEVIPQWIAGSITPEPQDHTKATFSKKITKEDGRVDLEHTKPFEAYKKIQAFADYPGAYFFTNRNGKAVRVKITDASFEDGVLSITHVIPEGKKEMAYQDFLRG
jgi:methionyl-tRNA formyltransferase